MWVTAETSLVLNLKNKELGLFVWTQSSPYVINLGRESRAVWDVCPQTAAYCAWFILYHLLLDILGPRMHCPCPKKALKGIVFKSIQLFRSKGVDLLTVVKKKYIYWRSFFGVGVNCEGKAGETMFGALENY